MRNRIVSLCLLMVLFISSCGNGKSSDPVSFMVFGEPAELKAYQELAAAFEKQNADVSIELIGISESGEISQTAGG